MKKGVLLFVLLFIFAVSVTGLVKGYLVYKRFTGVLHRKKLTREEKGTITNIVLKSTEKGKVVWVLKADKGRMERGNVLLETVKISYTGKKTGSLTITADRGFINKKKETGILEGNVILRLRSGILKAKRVVWRMKINEICVPGSFYFSGKYKIWGRKLCVYPKKEIIKVYNLKKVVIQ